MTAANPDTHNELLAAALTYATLGWPVFPCQPGTKMPLTRNGLNDATTDPDTIHNWWTRWPNANVAIATGGPAPVVIDIDTDHDGEHTLEKLETIHGKLPETLQAITGGDGWHHLYQDPTGALRNTASRLGPGIDTRGTGGYIIAPPSIHPNGNRYTWADDPTTTPIAQLPGWIHEQLNPTPKPAPTSGPTLTTPADGTTPYAQAALDARAHEVATATEGTRNHTLNAAAYRLGQLVAGNQIAEPTVITTLTTAAHTAGLHDREIHATITSGLAAGKTNPQHPDPTRTTRTTNPPVRIISDNTAPHDALADGFRNTDTGNADRFVAATNGHARYIHAWGRWIAYDATQGVWRLDLNDALTTEHAKSVARTMFATAATLTGTARDDLWKAAKKAESAPAIANMIRLARGTPGILTNHTDLDQQPWLLNCANGTLDLTTGELRPHNPDDLLTKQSPTRYDPTATAPLWDACTHTWQPDPNMRHYLQQIAGSGATGQPVEYLFVNLGAGKNGKSKFWGALQDVLGADYCVVPHRQLITVQKHEQHDTIKARLYGARLAIAAETDATDRLDEAKVKEITGSDTLEARRMREDPWPFQPSHTFVMHTNHRPTVRGVDEGIWRRIRLIPWDVTIPEHERDDYLADKLRVEASGILNWIVAGIASWREHGFLEPENVTAATTGYRNSQDSLAGFLDDCFVPAAGHRVPNRDVVDAYERWCEATGEEPVSKTALGRMLTDRGYTLTHDRRYRVGLRSS